jgi:hypothetical protein
MEQLLNYRRSLLERLSTIVDDLTAAVVAVPEKSWHVPVEPDGNTPHQILAHLRDIEVHALSVRLRRIIETDEAPVLPLFDDEAWMRTYYDPGEPPHVILDEYARLRQEELSWLQDLPSYVWNRTARHPCSGVRSLQWWVEQCLICAEDHLRRLKQMHT